MKIRKMKLENHPILRNLVLDFTDENNEALDTIILAGENGTGKTAILDVLYEFSLFELSPRKRDEKRIFEIIVPKQALDIISNINDFHPQFDTGFLNGVFKITLNYNNPINWTQIMVQFFDKGGNSRNVMGNFIHHEDIRPFFRLIYSDVEINYTPAALQSVTTKILDEKTLRSVKSGGNLATEITQLLIDIEAQDSQEFSQWAKSNRKSLVDESKLDVRMTRFTKAFDTIFLHKKFLGIENVDGNKKVLFEENGIKMPIDELSSGEKQIVFRGGFLLKDKEVNKGVIVLVDEPKISLHPKWQLEILDFYKNIVSSESDHSQIFVTTHSPFIIHNPNRRNDKVIILTKDADGSISPLAHPEFYSWSNSRIVKEAFQVDFNFLTHKNKLFVEGETDEKYIKKILEVFDLGNVLAFDVSWIGRINEKGGTEFSGDTALNHSRSFFLANSDLLHSKILLCYDGDTKKSEETYENLLIRTMPFNDKNTRFKKGIENLLNLPSDFDYSPFYSKRTVVDDYGGNTVVESLNKSKLCASICEQLTPDQQKEIFRNIAPLLMRFSEEIG
jgi:ABC-type Mn2+/Zn2+ transport system ATPase subunit